MGWVTNPTSRARGPVKARRTRSRRDARRAALTGPDIVAATIEEAPPTAGPESALAFDRGPIQGGAWGKPFGVVLGPIRYRFGAQASGVGVRRARDVTPQGHAGLCRHHGPISKRRLPETVRSRRCWRHHDQRGLELQLRSKHQAAPTGERALAGSAHSAPGRAVRVADGARGAGPRSPAPRRAPPVDRRRTAPPPRCALSARRAVPRPKATSPRPAASSRGTRKCHSGARSPAPQTVPRDPARAWATGPARGSHRHPPRRLCRRELSAGAGLGRCAQVRSRTPQRVQAGARRLWRR
jgi:hypothetical protein